MDETEQGTHQRHAELSLYDPRFISVDDAVTLASLLLAVFSIYQAFSLEIDPDVAFTSLICTILFLTSFTLALVYRSTPVLINIIAAHVTDDDITLRIVARVIGYISHLCFTAGILTFLLGGVCIQLRRYQDISYPVCIGITSPFLAIAALNILIASWILYYRIHNERSHATIIDNRSTSATERTPLLHFPMFK